MDPDSLPQGETQQQISDPVLDAKHVFPALGVRRPLYAHNEVDGFLLDYGCNLLPYIGLFSWIAFLLFGC